MTAEPEREPFERIADIRRCCVIFGVPLDNAGYRKDLEREDVDFVRFSGMTWPTYRQEVAEPAMRIIAEANQFGARVITDATLDDWEAMFHEPLDVVVLVTHWFGESIELRDGMHDVQAVIQRISPGFNGALDLCVCHPEPLAIAIRDFFPDALAHYPSVPANPRVFFPYIRALLWRLSQGDCSYLTASTEVVDAFLNG